MTFSNKNSSRKKTEPGAAKEHMRAGELWFRKEEEEGLREGKVTATIRLGDRTANTSDSKGGYKVGGRVVLKIQKEEGEFGEWQRNAVVSSVEKKKIGELAPDDFQNLGADRNKEELLKNFKKYYSRECTDDDIVTVVKFRYQD